MSTGSYSRVKNDTQSRDFILTHNYPPLDYFDIFVFRDGVLN